MRKLWLWLIPLLLLTFWLGVHYLDARPLWVDEALSLIDTGIGTRTPVDIWNGVATRNPWHPPGFFILLNLWGNLIGSDQAILRMLSLLLGLLAVTWTYRLGRDNVNARVGLFAAAILSTTVMLALYLDQIRVYTLLLLLTTVTLWQYLRILRLPHLRRRDWILLCLSVAAMLYAHYFSGIILGAIGLYHLIFVRKDRRWRTIVGAFALAGILFLPWVNVLIHGLNLFFSPMEFNGRALTNDELIDALTLLFSNGVTVLLVVAFVPALFARQRGGWRFWFFAAATFIPMFVLNGIFRVIPMTRLRYLLMLWPLFALVAALGIDWIGARGRIGRWVSLAILGVWIIAGLSNAANPALIRGLGGGSEAYPFQKIYRALDSRVKADDLIVNFWPRGMSGQDPNVITYYNALVPGKTVLISSKTGKPHEVDLTDAAQHDRIWLAYIPERRLEEARAFAGFQAFLTSYAQCAKPADSPALSVVLYAREAACCGSGDQPIARFGDDTIILSAIGSMNVQDNGAKMTFGWSIRPDVPLNAYSVTIQLFDDSGGKVAQNDYALSSSAYSCQTSVFDLAGLPPGDYETRVGVTALKTGQRLPGVTADGQTGDLLPVGTTPIGSGSAKGS